LVTKRGRSRINPTSAAGTFPDAEFETVPAQGRDKAHEAVEYGPQIFGYDGQIHESAKPMLRLAGNPE
jgi:hypothetical protein